MTLSFAGTIAARTVLDAVDLLVDLVGSPAVGAAWQQDSALPGLTVGGLTRHLVSQPECAVEFLSTPGPSQAPVLSLLDHYRRVDWLQAPVDAPENTSIRDDFNAMGAAGQAESVAVLARAREQLPAALEAADETTYVPWQDCRLATGDFLVVRLMEIVVHTDDLAASVGTATPRFGDDALEPALALLAALAARRHGQDAVLRALSRTERAGGPVSAF